MVNLLIILTAVFSGSFVQVNVNNTIKDSIEGRFYMNPPSISYIHVDYPVNQILLNNKDTLIIYYPESNEAFKIVTENPVSEVDASGNFLPILNDEMFNKMGLILVKKDYEEGYFIKYYSPVKKTPIKYLKLSFNRNLIYTMEVIDQKDNILRKSYFDCYNLVEDKNIPFYLKTITYTKKDSSVKIVKYIDIVKIDNVPDSIKNFEIPKNAEIKVVEW